MAAHTPVNRTLDAIRLLKSYHKAGLLEKAEDAAKIALGGVSALATERDALAADNLRLLAELAQAGVDRKAISDAYDAAEHDVDIARAELAALREAVGVLIARIEAVESDPYNDPYRELTEIGNVVVDSPVLTALLHTELTQKGPS